MGNREALLAGAKRCLVEKGYARTTARDIAAASGVSLAAIGYHYGSTEALLNAALIEAIGEWGDELGRVLAASADSNSAMGPLERFAAMWTQVIAMIESRRILWVATFEMFAQIEHAPAMRQFMADALQQGRMGLGTLFEGGDDASGDPADARRTLIVGSFLQALMTGVMAQWLADPARAPSGADLAEALRMIAGNTNT